MRLIDTDLALARHSYYEATAPRETAWAPLQGEAECDVAVVGGGLAGLCAALDLRRRGFSVTLLEARQVGYGGSGRNGGQVVTRDVPVTVVPVYCRAERWADLQEIFTP